MVVADFAPVKDVEIMSIASTSGAFRKLDIISDPNIARGRRRMVGDRGFVNPLDYKKVRESRRARTAMRILARLTEDFENRPDVKVNIMKRSKDQAPEARKE